MKELSEALLRTWGEALLKLQIHEPRLPGLFGGILCPACARIHGRCADAVHPFLYLAHHTGDKRYVQAAIDVMEWADSVTCTDGGWLNDAAGTWKGITVFGAIALGEALHRYRDLLPAVIAARWEDRYRRAMRFLDGFMTIRTGNINYPITATYAFALAAEVLGEPAYTARARRLAREVHGYFTSPGGLIFGEGQETSARGLPPVDLGYNVEESLPALIRYALLVDDRETLALAENSFRRHLDFMLPDGAWDNSWGTRQFKWTYWGSRTSDGAQPGLLLLGARDPVFAEAARRNTELLAACTHDGLLAGGPYYASHGEPICVHHTFCHAKALAAALELLPTLPAVPARVALPRETEGLRHISDVDTWLLTAGPWCATVTNYDARYYSSHAGHPSGGSLSLLWHRQLGPVCASSMNRYKLWEGPNQQFSLEWSDDGALPTLTPRLECRLNGEVYGSHTCTKAALTAWEEDGALWCRANGWLHSIEQHDPPAGPWPYELLYRLDGDGLTIIARANGGVGQVRLVVPLVSGTGEPVRRPTRSRLVIERPGGDLQAAATGAAILAPTSQRIFNYVPGLEALPVELLLPAHGQVTLDLRHG